MWTHIYVYMTEYKRGILYHTYKAECLKGDTVYIDREKWIVIFIFVETIKRGILEHFLY